MTMPKTPDVEIEGAGGGEMTWGRRGGGRVAGDGWVASRDGVARGWEAGACSLAAFLQNLEALDTR
mgnify:CR=1 FL=1